MNKTNDTIAMAERAELIYPDTELTKPPLPQQAVAIERFEALVAAKAAAVEREACAALIESYNTAITDKLAAAIRARGAA